jgi:hypothetical protein
MKNGPATTPRGRSGWLEPAPAGTWADDGTDDRGLGDGRRAGPDGRTDDGSLGDRRRAGAHRGADDCGLGDRPTDDADSAATWT